MAQDLETKPVDDSVAKVNGDVAIGDNLEFQRKWWKFERVVWAVFLLILIADVSGLLGRGPLAKAERGTPNGTLQVKYERVQRIGTPSIITILPEQAALRDGSLHLYVSDSLLRDLGAQRIIPQPVSSTLGNGGVSYVFAATQLPMTLQIALQPTFVGSHVFRLGTTGQDSIDAKVLVLP